MPLTPVMKSIDSVASSVLDGEKDLLTAMKSVKEVEKKDSNPDYSPKPGLKRKLSILNPEYSELISPALSKQGSVAQTIMNNRNFVNGQAGLNKTVIENVE